jgi:hypothetical protein
VKVPQGGQTARARAPPSRGQASPGQAVARRNDDPGILTNRRLGLKRLANGG